MSFPTPIETRPLSTSKPFSSTTPSRRSTWCEMLRLQHRPTSIRLCNPSELIPGHLHIKNLSTLFRSTTKASANKRRRVSIAQSSEWLLRHNEGGHCHPLRSAIRVVCLSIWPLHLVLEEFVSRLAYLHCSTDASSTRERLEHAHQPHRSPSCGSCNCQPLSDSHEYLSPRLPPSSAQSAIQYSTTSGHCRWSDQSPQHKHSKRVQWYTQRYEDG